MALKRKKRTVTFTDFINCDSSVKTTAFLSMFIHIQCSKCRQGLGGG